MTSLVYYVVRQRGGWGVEQAGMVRSGHRTLEDAIRCARAKAIQAREQGHDCSIRIQHEGGAWREERSFAPTT